MAGDATKGYSGDGGPATAAELDEPSGVAVDSAGDIFIADIANARIRKVDYATGIITTVAGNGTPGFSGDGGAATAAELSDTSSVAVDSAGDIFIADYGDNRIRKVDHASAVITTVAGSVILHFSGDGGAATAADLAPNCGGGGFGR